MTKVRRQQRRKRYRYNRKRMNRKKQPKMQSQAVKDAWKEKKSCQQNMKEMGLVYDVNKEIKTNIFGNLDKNFPKETLMKSDTVKQLEKDARKGCKGKSYRLPKGQVEYLMYLLNKYGDDYKAMARDKRNVNQSTWKQLRAKVKTFKNIPDQYNEYLKNKTDYST